MVRHVASPEGVRRFHAPIGTPIVGGRAVVSAGGGKKPSIRVSKSPVKSPSRSRTTGSKHEMLSTLRAHLKQINLKGRKDGAGTEKDPIDCGDDVDKAIKLLGEGKHIRLNQPDEVATMLDKLRTIVKEAEDKGEKAPNYDLCKVSVPKTNLFCAQHKGIERINMPQFKGANIRSGSIADGMPRDKKGEVDTADLFRQMLRDRGIKSEVKTVKASHLRASQMELVGGKVAGMSKAMAEGKVKDEPIFVTRDGYIIDGHHRWASKIAIDLEDNHLGDVDMPVEMIDLDIGTALDLANAFTKEVGILPKGASAEAKSVFIMEVREWMHEFESKLVPAKNGQAVAKPVPKPVAKPVQQAPVGQRLVRTQPGSRKYKKPIGQPIGKAKETTKPKSNVGIANNSPTSIVKVKQGDTLWDIAKQQLGDPQRWREIAQLNGIKDPRQLQVGTALKMPGKTAGALIPLIPKAPTSAKKKATTSATTKKTTAPKKASTTKKKMTGKPAPSKSSSGAGAAVHWEDGSVLYTDGTMYDAVTGTMK